jgi:hypothetical protein
MPTGGGACSVTRSPRDPVGDRPWSRFPNVPGDPPDAANAPLASKDPTDVGLRNAERSVADIRGSGHNRRIAYRLPPLDRLSPPPVRFFGHGEHPRGE